MLEGFDYSKYVYQLATISGSKTLFDFSDYIKCLTEAETEAQLRECERKAWSYDELQSLFGTPDAKSAALVLQSQYDLLDQYFADLEVIDQCYRNVASYDDLNRCAALQEDFMVKYDQFINGGFSLFEIKLNDQEKAQASQIVNRFQNITRQAKENLP
jgi:hypothetical protein